VEYLSSLVLSVALFRHAYVTVIRHEGDRDERTKEGRGAVHGREPWRAARQNGSIEGGITVSDVRERRARERQASRIGVDGGPTGESGLGSSGCHGAASLPLDPRSGVFSHMGGSRGRPLSSPPPVSAAATFHGGLVRSPTRSFQASAALASASTVG
jgi:hypothetical protein